MKSDYQLIVLGSGPAGRRAAIQAAKLGKSVLVIEARARVGGVSVHTGTIPSKTLRETALNLSGWRERGFYGQSYRVKKVIGCEDLNTRLGMTLDHEVDVLEHQFMRNGVDTIAGRARFAGPHRVAVALHDGTELQVSGERILIAVGTVPHRPEKVDFSDAAIMDSDEICDVPQMPRSLTVVGAGVIGIEYATIFSALDVAVTVVEPRATILDFVDREIVDDFIHQLRDRGMRLRLGAAVTSVARSGEKIVAQLDDGRSVASDMLLYCAGRMGATATLDLAACGLAADERGRLKVDPETFQTPVPHIYAAGDVIGFPSLASTSMEQGRIAACHAFDLPLPPAPQFFPYGIYAVPEISTVGLSEDRTLTINLRQGTLAVKGSQRALERGVAIAFDGELYLRSEAFAEILPLRLTPDLRAQSVDIETFEEFPFRQRIERELQRSRLAGKQGQDGAKQWPREETPWRALAVPMADVEVRAVSDSEIESRVEGDLRVAGDFAFLTARTYFSGSSRDGLTGARIELGRRDPDGELFGPLGATEFQIGDVSTVALPLGLRGIGGRGAAITNAPIDQASLFDAIDLRGELPEGYEVELYRNDILLASTRLPVNGQYEFLQVPVDFGFNVFRLVFYGPQGQRYEDVRRISVGDGRRKPGELVYAFGMAQKDVNLLNVRGPFDSRPPDLGTWRATGTLEYGVTSGLTAELAGSWFETTSGNSWLASAGLRTGFGGTALRADLGIQKGGGKSAQVGVGGKLLGMTYALTHAEYSGKFIDEVRAFSSEFLDRASEFTANATLKLGGEADPIYIPLSLRARRLEFATGRELTEVGLRASTRVAGLQLSKTFDYAHTVSQFGSKFDRLSGGFDLATLAGSKTQYRAGLAYSVLPEFKLQSAAVQIDHAFDRNTLVSASLGHFFLAGETRVGLSASRRFDNFTLSFDGDYAFETRNHTAALRLGFGFGHNPLTGRFFVGRPGLANGGAAAIRAYHDRDADGRFGQGDTVLPEVRFGIGGQSVTTDKHGVAMISRLGDGTRAN
jgi:pyruvate/2-oxoglutarate dehydrogenase complex dihydrolipoamide dehydrogenase (E3) component